MAYYPSKNWCSKKAKREKDISLVSRFGKVVKACRTEKSKISLMGVGADAKKDGYSASQLYLAGGLNGNGVWSDYLHDIATIVDGVRKEFDGEAVNVVVSDMDMDLIDDIFYPTINVVWSYDK